MSLEEIYRKLPNTERSLEKRSGSMPFHIERNEAAPGEWVIVDDRKILGSVVYTRGRKRGLQLHMGSLKDIEWLSCGPGPSR